MSQWICQENEENFISISLPHPRTGLPARYIIQDGNLFEAQRIDCSSQNSWFIKDTIQKDGSMILFTRIDPLFLMIPFLENSRRKNLESPGFFLTLEDILDNTDYPSTTRLLTINNILTYMEWICDGKVYRLNDDKMMKWLKGKVTNLLSKFDQHKSLRKLAEQLDNETINDQYRQELRTKFILEVIMEYLPNYWTEQLKKEYKFDELGKWSNQEIFYMTDNTPKYSENKQIEVEDKKPKRKLTPGQTTLAKANKTGMKKLSTFFSKIPKE
ncbi:7469_t:CDS:10 [Diversispora eburnea]|uniref:Ribonuclease H2 subunit B n=1 Tax=Diversispora eburnea TaxID=1213867 RepID=A0A9N9AAZ1_9GLOM|nr:7469_t:CDS:10 [Diversispora eburnea]